MDLEKKALDIVKKRIDIAGIISDVLTEIADEALTELVAKSDNKWDDVAKAALWPPLKAELERLSKQLIDKL